MKKYLLIFAACFLVAIANDSCVSSEINTCHRNYDTCVSGCDSVFNGNRSTCDQNFNYCQANKASELSACEERYCACGSFCITSCNAKCVTPERNPTNSCFDQCKNDFISSCNRICERKIDIARNVCRDTKQCCLASVNVHHDNCKIDCDSEKNSCEQGAAYRCTAA